MGSDIEPRHTVGPTRIIAFGSDHLRMMNTPGGFFQSFYSIRGALPKEGSADFTGVVENISGAPVKAAASAATVGEIALNSRHNSPAYQPRQNFTAPSCYNYTSWSRHPTGAIRSGSSSLKRRN